MSNTTDLASVAKGAKTRKQSDRLVVALTDDQSQIVGMRGDNIAFVYYTEFMQPNHYNGDVSLQTFVCAKGGRDIALELLDSDGNVTGADGIGYFKTNCKIDNEFLVDAISKKFNIDITPPKK